MSKHRGKKKHVTVGHQCECCDPKCPVGHGSNTCLRGKAGKMRRIDFGDGSTIYFCKECGEDALASGVFG